MQSRSTARRTPPPEPSRTAEPAPPRTRATSRTSAPGGRRPRRTTELPLEPTPLEPAAPPLATDPGELYRREKSRRGSRVDPAVMAEARKLLEEAMTPIGGRKRGGTVTVGQAARKRKPALAPDEFDLPEYRPGSSGGDGAAKGGDEEE
ncbi:MAG: hypothetical protein ACXWZS_06115 [Gemmatirosa sp.]